MVARFLAQLPFKENRRKERILREAFRLSAKAHRDPADRSRALGL
jgi:hypothetical protein